jgi:cytochrome c556
MADNTTTYNAVIDVQVKGKDGVEDLGDAVQENDGKFVSLRRQIRETTVALQKLADEGKAGTKEFKDLSDKLDDLGDQQKKVAFQSGQIEDKLAALPGPIGSIGKSLQGAKDAIDTFGKGIAISLGVVTLIVTAILSFKEALSRTEEGQAKLNKISEAFEKIMNGIFAIIEPIAMLFADLVIELLSSKKAMDFLSKAAGVLSATFTVLFGVGKALVGFIYNNFVNAFNTLGKVAGGVGKILKGVFTFDLAIIKEGLNQIGEGIKTSVTSFVDNAKTTAKGIGTAVVTGVTEGFAAGEKAFVAGQKRMTKKEKEAAAQKKKEAAEQAKKNAEEAMKNMTEAEKTLTEARLALLDERNSELKKRELKFIDDKKKLQKAGIKDFTLLEQAYGADVAKINKKYDELAAKAVEEKNKKLKEEVQKGIDDRVALIDTEAQNIVKKTETGYQKRIAEINAKEKELLSKVGLSEEEKKKIVEQAEADRNTAINLSYSKRIQAVNDREKELLASVKVTELDRLANMNSAGQQLLSDEQILENKRSEIIKNAAAERQAVDKDDYDARIKLVNDKEKELLSNAYLTESERTAIKIKAEDDRKVINKEALDNQVLTNDNAFRQQLATDAQNYDALVALVDEKERLLLSNVELTEAQRTAIQQGASEERANIRAGELEEKLLGTENELAQVGLEYDRRLQLVNEKEALLLQQAGLTENQKTQIAQQASQERVNIMLAEKQARADIQNAELDLVQGFGSFLKEIAGKNKKLAIAGVVVEQAAAIGKILVNTGIANAKSVAASPLTFGQPWVTINTISAALGIASSVAAGAKAIQQINSADSGTPATASAPKSGGGGGSAASAPEPKLPTIEKVKAPEITGTTGGNNPTSQIAQTLSKATDKPIKAYVVSGDVTSQQALDRRTSRAATFNG